MFSTRSNILAAEVVVAALTLAGCARNQQDSSRETATPSAGTATTAPITTQPVGATFSRSLRAALQDTHDHTADNNFSAAVLGGKVTASQYEVALKQNLAIFQTMQEAMASDRQLPPALREQFLKDLGEVVSAFRRDLKLGEAQQLSDTDILSSTRALLEMLRTQSPQGLAVCSYLDLGGNAFGTHDLAEALESQGFKNTEGFTVYTHEKFRALAAQMNNTFNDSTQFSALIESGRGFYQAHERIYAAEVFVSR